MDRSDLQEILFSLYLRLNGYFVTGFIVHASQGNITELDALAVRFPYHKEPEREINTCEHLDISNEKIDFLICEVKSGQGNIQFNNTLRTSRDALNSVLNRFGAFSDVIIDDLVSDILKKINHVSINNSQVFPIINVPGNIYQIRCILVASEQTRENGRSKPYIFGDDMIQYIWKCLRPENTRERCGIVYNWNLWGEQYQKFIEYFKDSERIEPGDINDIYDYFEL